MTICHLLDWVTKGGRTEKRTFVNRSTGQAKYVIGEGPDGLKLGATLKPIRIGPTMYDRMGR